MRKSALLMYGALTAMACVVLVGLLSRVSLKAQPATAKSVVDGSITPDLIPDEQAYALVLLTASYPVEGSSQLERARAAAFLAALPFGEGDRQVVDEHAKLYRANKKKLAMQQFADDADALKKYRALANSTISSMNAKLSSKAAVAVRDFVRAEKRAMKLYPMPQMSHKVAMGWLDRLLGVFELTVHAQGMQLTSSLYTNLTVDDDDNIYVTGTTNAESSCYCHTTDATLIIETPSGRQIYYGPVNGGEVVQATTSLTLEPADFIDNSWLRVKTVHNATCPFAGRFVNNAETTQNPPIKVIQAYYKCDASNGACTQTLGHYVHRRCNSGRCPTILSRQNNWLFSLLKVAEMNVGAFSGCVADKKTAQQQTACHTPDPKP